jgi:acyl-CoA synthetase (AMP-forming)/AMP-acid ligase II
LPGIKVEIIEVSEQPFASIDECIKKTCFEIGEIIVKGSVVTRAYENNEPETTLSKIPDNDGFWHRIGDMGYLDEQGRLWFCGRKAHRVHTKKGVMYTIPCEAIINEHPHVFRSALVGINDTSGFEEPAIIVETAPGSRLGHKKLLEEIKELAAAHQLTKSIEHFFIHPSFPVDIRHNAKIFREKLKIWAQNKTGERR